MRLRTFAISSILGTLAGIVLPVCGSVDSDMPEGQRWSAKWETRPDTLTTLKAGDSNSIPVRTQDYLDKSLDHLLAAKLREYPAAAEALELLHAAESSRGKRMSGDSGLARGHLGQHEDSWNEACAFAGYDFTWPDDTNDLTKCKLVAIAYWQRYASDYMYDRDELIRRHRLPFAPYRIDNDLYLARVLKKGW